jgi:hypothetical protein
MHAIAFLALLTIALLVLAALRLELDFRRTAEARPGAGPGGGEPERRRPEAAASRPELRAPPAGGYWQAPFSRAA